MLPQDRGLALQLWGLALGAAIVAAACRPAYPTRTTISQSPTTTTHEPAPSAVSTGGIEIPAGEGAIITGTLTLHETAETIEAWGQSEGDSWQRRFNGTLGQDLVVWITDVYRNGNLESRRVVTRDKAGRRVRTTNPQGAALHQDGEQLHTELTDDIRRAAGYLTAEDMPERDSRLADLVDYETHPSIHWRTVRQLAAERLLTVTEGESLLGVPVAVVDAGLGARSFWPATRVRSWVTVADGLVLKHQAWWHDGTAEPDLTFEVEDYDTGLALGDAYFAPEYLDMALDASAWTD